MFAGGFGDLGKWGPGDGRKPPSVTPAVLRDGAGDIDLCALPSDPKTGRIGHLGLLPGGLAVSSGPHRRQGRTHHPVGCGGAVSAPLPVLSHPPWKGLQCLEEGGLSSAAVKGHRRSPTISRQSDRRIICYLKVQTEHGLGRPSRTQHWEDNYSGVHHVNKKLSFSNNLSISRFSSR